MLKLIKAVPGPDDLRRRVTVHDTTLEQRTAPYRDLLARVGVEVNLGTHSTCKAMVCLIM